MNPTRRLILRSLRFHARGHAGTFLGVTVAAAVLVGALAVGDCVRESLRDLALARLGKVTHALASRDRFFRPELADSFKNAAPVLQLAGSAAIPDGSARANHVQVLGVDDRFWSLAQTPASLPEASVLLNIPLARQLHVKIGDTVLLRVPKPSFLSLEAPTAPRDDVSTSLRLQVAGILPDAQFGRFSLQANQAAPFNAFVPLRFLQNKTGLDGKANLLLTAGIPDALSSHWKLADAELGLRDTPGGVELRTDRVFLDQSVVESVASLHPRPISTYFVNELRAGDKSTPYSMVTAAGEPLVPTDMRDDEIIINQWLADDLQAAPGGVLTMKCFVIGAALQLEQKSAQFRIRAVVPMTGPADDRSLMPDFPGIAKAEKTANWDAGFAIDLGKIRLKDEQYWKEHRGTPKAFVTLAAGRQIWGNRFGDFTALRFPAGTTKQTVEQTVLTHLDPAAAGLAFQPVREQALAASSQSEDFGGLFLSFSFFLIVAALILMALLFQFGLERRATEIGTLLALGFRPRQVRRLLLAEGTVIAVLGGLAGMAGGILYARGILFGLTTLWSAAVGDSALTFHVTATTLSTGVVSSIIVSTLVIWLALRSQTRKPARELLERGGELESPGSKRRYAGWVAAVSGLGALVMIGSALGKHGDDAVEAFFCGGTLLLICEIALAAVWFRSLATKSASHSLSLTALGWRGCARQRKRSLATMSLLAAGSFLIVAVEANKLDARQDSRERSAGTGGFAFIGESALPVVQDLNSREGRDFFGLDETQLQGVEFVPMRVRDGDDASCLNLNRAQTPRLLGVNPELLQSRKAFTFSDIIDKTYAAKPWMLLATAGDEIPAIGDSASITWALGKKVGDTIDYIDEHGNKFKLRLVGALANSILQGNLIIDEDQFVKRFPGESGHRMFLVDAPSNSASAVAAALTRALQAPGLELTPSAARLNAFNAVQNTYLNTFQVLGGLGLLLGSAGLGVVVLRNVLERRAELAAMAALGFRRRALRWLIISEHGALECLGLLAGIVAALLAVLPAVLVPGSQISFRPLAAVLGLVFTSGILWTWAAARVALRGPLLTALRNE